MTKYLIKSVALIAFSAIPPMTVVAQSPSTSAPIIEHIEKSNRHTLTGSPAILELLNIEEESNVSEKRRPAMRTVYRVQVFSDNKGERSRTEGEKKQRAVQSKFPDYPVALGWSSPYWKVKVGIFQTQEEASEAASKLKKAFPAYAREIHVIRDRIKIAN